MSDFTDFEGVYAKMCELDIALLNMIADNRKVIVKVGIDPDNIESWDVVPEEAGDVCYAIAFIAGCAAAFDVTPLTLLDYAALALKPGPWSPKAKRGRKRMKAESSRNPFSVNFGPDPKQVRLDKQIRRQKAKARRKP